MTSKTGGTNQVPYQFSSMKEIRDGVAKNLEIQKKIDANNSKIATLEAAKNKLENVQGQIDSSKSKIAAMDQQEAASAALKAKILAMKQMQAQTAK